VPPPTSTLLTGLILARAMADVGWTIYEEDVLDVLAADLGGSSR
jgi:hypothetical protein